MCALMGFKVKHCSQSIPTVGDGGDGTLSGTGYFHACVQTKIQHERTQIGEISLLQNHLEDKRAQHSDEVISLDLIRNRVSMCSAVEHSKVILN